MSRLFAHKWRLRPSILTLFIVLTAPVFFAIVGITYLSNDAIARSDADALVERFRVNAVADIENMLAPVRSLVRSAAVLGDQQPDFYSDNRALPYLLSTLLHSETIVSVYVGLADGSFRQARRIDPAVPVQGRLPPAGVRFAYRWIEPPGGAVPVDHYRFLDADKRELGATQAENPYDPRARFWYRHTVAQHGLTLTDPEVFATLGLIGFTVAAPFYADGKVAGVAAADITLDGLSAYLAEHKVSPGTLSYLLDRQGGVIANSARATTYADDHGTVSLEHIASLPDALPAVAFGARPRQGASLYSFGYGGEEYRASYSALPAELGQRWHLFTITPLRDFTGAFDRHNLHLLYLGLIAIAVQIVVIYFLSAAISSPLERLSRKVAGIESFSGETAPPLESPVHEIAVLSKAIDTLDNTVKSFSAYVPVGLVRQLIGSDRKLELGGHSRFLTIFFSDLEAFSSLSEELPSRDLLLRVSSYLGVVTKAVNDEAGTIDKFIGDGVMAFWGAPGLLEDHAWRACVAALRIERGMAALNEAWRADGLKPLNIRIGLHSDAVVVGNIGSPERMSYTVIGDGVNVAARLEGINKDYGTRICISHAVFKEAGERLCVRPIDDVAVKGRRVRIPIYELIGAYGIGAEFEPDAATLQLCRLTRFAYEALVQEDFAVAVERYRAVLAEFPDDPVANELVRRLAPSDPARRIHRHAAR